MELKKINEYVRKAHDIAGAHGFHDEPKSSRHFLCLIVSELMEAVEADRKGNRASIEAFEDALQHEPFTEAYKEHIKGSVEEEFADVAIRIFDLLGEKYPYGIRAIDGIVQAPKAEYSFTEKAYEFVYFVLGSSKSQLVGSVQYMDAWAKQLDFDLDWHIRQKMAFNETRQKLHGKKY